MDDYDKVKEYMKDNPFDGYHNFTGGSPKKKAEIYIKENYDLTLKELEEALKLVYPEKFICY